MDALAHGKKQVVPAPRTPRVLRVGVLALELSLVVLVAYQAVTLMYRVLEPEDTVTASGSIKPHHGRQAANLDMSRLTGLDPFFRQITSDTTLASAQAAPESSLKLELFGLRATGSGQGSAIVKAQDGQQKLVRVGDTISPGVKLAGVYADRLEIIRSGSLEAVYLRPQGSRMPTAVKPPPARKNTRQGSNSMLATLSTLKLEAVRRERRIIGFRLPQDMPDMASGLGLEGGDILLAANGEPLNSFERIAEIGEELAGARRVDLTIERRGETRSLSLGL